MVLNKLRHAYLGSEGMITASTGVVQHASKAMKELIESTRSKE
jgi:hypothetical protein